MCVSSSQFDRLQEVVLRGENVNGAGPPGAIASLLPRVTILNLSKCLLTSWADVASITTQLPLLKTLNLR